MEEEYSDLPSASTAQPHVPSQAPSAEDMLQIYIYDYFRKHNFHNAADAILMETQEWQNWGDWPPPLAWLGDSRHSLLFEWWSAFWQNWTEYRAGVSQGYQAGGGSIIAGGSGGSGGGGNGDDVGPPHVEGSSTSWDSESPKHPPLHRQLFDHVAAASAILSSVDTRRSHDPDPDLDICTPSTSSLASLTPPLPPPLDFAMEAVELEPPPTPGLNLSASHLYQQSVGFDASDASACTLSSAATPSTPYSSLGSETDSTTVFLEEAQYLGQQSNLKYARDFNASESSAVACYTTSDLSQTPNVPLMPLRAPVEDYSTAATWPHPPLSNMDMLNANFLSPLNIAEIERTWATRAHQASLQSAEATRVQTAASTVSFPGQCPPTLPLPGVRSHLQAPQLHRQLIRSHQELAGPSATLTPTGSIKSQTPESPASSSLTPTSSRRQYSQQLVTQCMRQLSLGEEDVFNLTNIEKAASADRIGRLQRLQAEAQSRIAMIHSASPGTSFSLRPSPSLGDDGLVAANLLGSEGREIISATPLTSPRSPIVPTCKTAVHSHATRVESTSQRSRTHPGSLLQSPSREEPGRSRKKARLDRETSNSSSPL